MPGERRDQHAALVGGGDDVRRRRAERVRDQPGGVGERHLDVLARDRVQPAEHAVGARRVVGQRRHAEREQRPLDEVPVRLRDHRSQVHGRPFRGHRAGMTTSHAVRPPVGVRVHPVQGRVQLGRVVVPDAAEHAKAAGPADRRGDLLGRAEAEDRVLDAEQVAHRRPDGHGALSGLRRGGGGMLGGVAVRPAVVGLARHGAADRVHEPDGARRLVAGQQAVHVRLEGGLVGGGPGAQLDQGGHPLAEPVVGHADDQCVEHVGVGLQRALDLFGVDLLAAGVHAGVAPAEQGDRAVFLDPGPVAGHRVAPAVRPRRTSRAVFDRVVVVAERDVPAAGQLAGLPGAAHAARLVDHDDVRARRDRGTAAAARRPR